MAARGPFLPGPLFLVLGQGRWSGFRRTSGFSMAAPVEGLPVPVLIAGRLVMECDVVSLRGMLRGTALHPSGDRLCCGADALTTWFRLNPSLVSCMVFAPRRLARPTVPGLCFSFLFFSALHGLVSS